SLATRRSPRQAVPLADWERSCPPLASGGGECWCVVGSQLAALMSGCLYHSRLTTYHSLSDVHLSPLGQGTSPIHLATLGGPGGLPGGLSLVAWWPLQAQAGMPALWSFETHQGEKLALAARCGDPCGCNLERSSASTPRPEL